MCILQSHSIHISCDSLFSLFGLNIFSSFSQFSWIHTFLRGVSCKMWQINPFFALFLAFPVVYCEEVYCPYNPISAYPVGFFVKLSVCYATVKFLRLQHYFCFVLQSIYLAIFSIHPTNPANAYDSIVISRLIRPTFLCQHFFHSVIVIVVGWRFEKTNWLGSFESYGSYFFLFLAWFETNIFNHPQ